jgi:hypothetical protein
MYHNRQQAPITFSTSWFTNRTLAVIAAPRFAPPRLLGAADLPSLPSTKDSEDHLDMFFSSYGLP